MDRIATNTAYSSVLANLMQAEIAQTNAGTQLSSQVKAQDLAGYGGGAETLTAMQSTNNQVTGYLNNTQTVGAKLAVQDSALTEVGGAAASAIQAVTQALGTGNGAGLMSALQNAFGSAVEGLNTTFNGEYVFAGGQVTTQPVSATSLSDLTSAPSIASLFHNDQRITSNQIDSNTTISTGFVADQVGTPLFQSLQAIEAFDQGPNGPLSGNLTTAQTTFLTQQLAGLNTAQSGLTAVTAQNGLAQNEVTATQSALTSRQTMLTNLIGNIDQADVAQATTNLQQAQLSIQAAGQVFQALNASSLLNTLTATQA